MEVEAEEGGAEERDGGDREYDDGDYGACDSSSTGAERESEVDEAERRSVAEYGDEEEEGEEQVLDRTL